MAELRESIERIRFANSNFEDRYFVPEAALHDAIPESAIKHALESLEIPIHEIRDLTQGIVRGARKCFAILLLIGCGNAISSFFRRDSMQQSSPDSRLPYTSEALQQIFGEEVASPRIKNFLEKQWEFTIPIFHQDMIFRELDSKVILPFLYEESAGRGSMGTAWKIKLHPQCHRLPMESHEVIKKEIDCGTGDGIGVFQKELKNLSLLTHLKHPNIVRLYCSYVYRGRYNLIFAVADHGSLDAFLCRESHPGAPVGPRLLLALTELTSAIDALHNFTSDAYDLSLSGCHHDLAPRNILVHGETFLLADFGLSTFRNPEEDSLTTFKEVRGSYVAPECQTLQGGHVRSQKIGRASDIWSFGCILSEVLTHMVWGPAGVLQFRAARKVEVMPGIEWYRFHQGPDTPSRQVGLWLDKLQDNGEPFMLRLVTLIREMLSMDPQKRPPSARVLAVLRGVSILSIAGAVDQAMNGGLYLDSQSINHVLNKMRFRSWLFALHRLLDRIGESDRNKVDFDFATMIQALTTTHHILQSDSGISSDVTHQQQSLIRYQHTRLIEALPSYYRSIAKEHLVSLVMEIPDVEQLGDLSTAMNEGEDEDIGVLITVKHLTLLAEMGRLVEQNSLVLNQNDIMLKPNDIGIHSLAVVEPTSEPVLVEWLRYKESWADEVIGLELRHRLTSVVGLLHSDSTTRIPGSLSCRGLFHDPSYRAFGIIYNIPATNSTPVTLHQLLSLGDKSRPPLDYRFQLAHDICQCIYTFHRIGWLHRNLHSMNVLFFPPDGSDIMEWAKEPRILGFAASRENQLGSFTQGPEDDSQLRDYQHPKYLSPESRYREEFDFYSVGMLLLEIGFWNTLSELTASPRFRGISHEQFRQEVIASRVSKLRTVMGIRYMEVTRKCLEGGFGQQSRNTGDPQDAYNRAFKNLVMDRIPQIN